MSERIIRGIAHKYGDNINTDLISPAQYMEMPVEVIASHAMEGVDSTFTKKIKSGDIIVAGKNFGSGSSRETAPIAIKRSGISLVIAEFFARIFYRNCINIGLPVLICPQASEISDKDELEVDLSSGLILNINNGFELQCDSLPENIIELVKDGGLLPNIKRKLL